MRLDQPSAFFCVVLALCLAGAGCATKRQVREAIAPVQNQINQTQNQVNGLKDQIFQDQQHIGDLDRRIATDAERAADAQSKSREALQLAQRAADTASQAARSSDAAVAIARQAQRDVAGTNQRIDAVFSSLDSYQLAFSESIYFGFSESGLSKEEQPKLDRAVRRIKGMKSFIVEIEGFTDSSGDPYANRELSRERADSVVHYMVVEHGVPLRTISELGAGADFPRADNQTPNARRQNRRVDIRVFSLNQQASPPVASDASKP